MEKYDSEKDTKLHIKRVQELIMEAIIILSKRALLHDRSKLENPEKQYFDEHTLKLRGMTYGSSEYKESLEELKVALKHHYEHNSHHPEHYDNGLDDFDLFDLIEMFFDWKAATERHEDGNIFKSLDLNKDRFNMSDQLYKILFNTAKRLKWK